MSRTTQRTRPEATESHERALHFWTPGERRCRAAASKCSRKSLTTFSSNTLTRRRALRRAPTTGVEDLRRQSPLTGPGAVGISAALSQQRKPSSQTELIRPPKHRKAMPGRRPPPWAASRGGKASGQRLATPSPKPAVRHRTKVLRFWVDFSVPIWATNVVQFGVDFWPRTGTQNGRPAVRAPTSETDSGFRVFRPRYYCVFPALWHNFFAPNGKNFARVSPYSGSTQGTHRRKTRPQTAPQQKAGRRMCCTQRWGQGLLTSQNVAICLHDLLAQS